MKENVWPGEQLYSLVSLYTNVCLMNAVIDQSEWSIPESRVIVCGWLYIIAYIMLLWLISNKQQGLCTTSVSKTILQLRHYSPSHLISSVSCPAGLKCCSFLHPFGSSRLFSSPVHYVSPRLFRSVVFCYPRKSSVASLLPFFTFLSAVSDSCLFLPSHITIVRLIPSLPLSGPVFLWWVTSRHFHASSLVHVAASPLSGLDSHSSTFSILQRRNICPSAVRILLFTLMSFQTPVLFSCHFFNFFFFFTRSCLLLYLIYDIFSLGVKFPFTIVCFLKYTNKISNKLF